MPQRAQAEGPQLENWDANIVCWTVLTVIDDGPPPLPAAGGDGSGCRADGDVAEGAGEDCGGGEAAWHEK